MTSASTLPTSDSAAFLISALEVTVTGSHFTPRRSASACASLFIASELVSAEFQMVPIVFMPGLMAKNRSKLRLTGGTV